MMKKLIFYLLTAVCALLYAPPLNAADYTFYVDNSSTNWTTVRCYYWDNAPSSFGDAPEGQLVPGTSSIYKITFSNSSLKGIIFTNGLTGNGNQTTNVEGNDIKNGHLYTLTAKNNAYADWSVSTSAYTPPVVKNYTFYFDNSAVAVADLPFNGWNPPKVYYNGTHNNMTLKEGKIYSYTITATSAPKVQFTDGQLNSYGNDGHNTEEVTISDGYVYKINGKNSSWVYTTTSEEYNPVSVTSVELLKKSAGSIGTKNAAPYTFSLSGLTGTEEFLVRVNYDNSTSKTYTVSSGTSLKEGTDYFKIDSKIINTVMTVTVSGTAATSYSLNGTVNDAITGVYLGNDKMNGSNGKYTLSGVANNTTGYTVKVTTTRNAAGTTYTVASGNNLLAGKHTLTAGTTNFTVASTLATFNAEVAVNTSTFVPTSITIADPAAVISEVSIVSHDGSQNYKLTSKDGGLTWTGRSTVKAFDDSGKLNINDSYGKTAAYHIAVKNDGADEKWYYQSNDYGLSKETTYSSNWKKTTGTDYFRFAGAGNTDEYQFTVTLSADKKSVASFKYEKYEAPAANLYMPLTEEDFKDGPRYFLVGVRTADWRLQPEWELKVNASRTAASLSGRLMYQQWFGIAKVDNYNNYVHHRYTLYGNTGTPKIYTSDSGKSYDLNYSDPNGRASDYKGATAGQGSHPVSKMFMWYGEQSGWSAVTWTQTAPSLLEDVTITLGSDGTPGKVTFNFTQDADKVGAARTISLTGENIKWNDMFTFSDGTARDLATMTPGSKLQRNSDDVSNRWGNAWVQYDNNGRPYVDGNGDLVYNTAFDAEWLSEHHVRFYNKEKDLEYSSLNATFLPAEMISEDQEEFQKLYMMHPYKDQLGYNRIGNNETRNITPLNYKEAFDDNFKDGRNYIDNSGWQCYVVKNMWLEGQFKLWTGWGGNMKIYNDVDDGKYDTAEQWFFENGGHQTINLAREVKGYDVSVNGANVTVYPTRRDREQANFNIPQMTYYSRVILWYNPDQGFENSVLQLVRAQYGPNIQAFHNLETRNTLRYEWWIDSQDESNDDVKITGYEVKRYKVVGSQLTNETTVEATPGNSANYQTVGYFKDSAGKTINKIEFKDDSRAIPAGQYIYTIWVTFDNGMRKEATSNVVTINEVAVPVTMEVDQVMEDGKYTFDIDVTVKPNAADLNKKVGEGDDAPTVREMMRYYVITAGEPTAKRLNEETSEQPTIGGQTVTFTQAAANEILIADGTYLPAGTWYYRHEITDKSNPDLTLRWKNATPNMTGAQAPLQKWDGEGANRGLITINRDHVATYMLRAYLVSADSDIDQWALLNFDVASDGTDVIAPRTNIDLSNMHLRRYDKAFIHEPKENNAHLPGTRIHAYDEEGNWLKENPVIEDKIIYQRSNEVVADAKIDALPLADRVLTDWTVTYHIYAMPEDKALADNYGTEKYLNTMQLKGTDAVTAEMADFDLSGLAIHSDGSIDGHIADYFASEQAAGFNGYVLVGYQRKAGWSEATTKELINDKGASGEAALNLSLPTPEVSLNDVSWTAYRERRYWDERDENNNVLDHGYHLLGYFIHAGIDLRYSLENSENLAVYAGFGANQTCVGGGPSANGVHKYSGKVHNYGPTYDASGTAYPHWMFSFCDTQAANGGHPLNFTHGTVQPLEGYVDYDDKSEEKPEWVDDNDWSTKVVAQGRMPIHVNPVFELTEEQYNGGKNSILPDYHNFGVSVAAYYPVITADKVSFAVKGATPASSPSRLQADDTHSGVRLFQASTWIDVDLSKGSQTTGVEDITADDDNAPVEYYNLQGIRVIHPAKGQIYIVRQGEKVSKQLMK